MRRIFIFALLALASAAGSASALPSYQYTTDAVGNGGTINAVEGQVIAVNIYLVESGATTGTFNIRNTGGGLAGFGVALINTSGASGKSRVNADNSFVNDSSNTTGFQGPASYQGPIGTFQNPTGGGPAVETADEAFLAAISTNQAAGPVTATKNHPPIPDGGAALNGKILLVTAEIIAHAGDSLFKLTNADAYFGSGNTQTLNPPGTGTGLDASSAQFTGANANPFVFHVVVATAGIPEPSSMALCGFAFGGMGLSAWRRYKAKKLAAAEKTEEVPAAI